MVAHQTLKALVGLVLAQPFKYTWSVQGLGMLRLYLGSVGRLHIWDDRLEYPRVSKIHNHSWPLRSTIVVGSLRNQRYELIDAASMITARAYYKQRAITGFNFTPVGPPTITLLRPYTPENFKSGDVYEQRPDEVHHTEAERGTITIMERPSDGDTGEAEVFWPVNETWVNAIPRPATHEEIEAVTRHAWNVHFNGSNKR